MKDIINTLDENIKYVIDALFNNAMRKDLKDNDLSVIDYSFMALMNLL